MADVESHFLCCRRKRHCLQTHLRQNRATSKRPGTGGTSDLDRSKTGKIMTFIDRAHFYLMLIVAPVTSRTNDVRSSDAEQW